MKVDVVLKPSRYRRWAAGLAYGLVAGCWLLSPVSVWSTVVVLGMLLIGVLLTRNQSRQQTCISLYQRDDGGWQWQTDQHPRWIHGQLHHMSVLPWVVVLVFDCTAIKRQQRVVIWQDQVAAADWRRLQVVGAWSSCRSSLIEG